MKVQLINVAEYNIKEDKVSEVPFDTFVNLCGGVDVAEDPSLPRVRLFKSIDEFKKLSQEELMEINQEESIRVLQNGQFLVFLERSKDKEKEIKTVKSNATTDTKENKGE